MKLYLMRHGSALPSHLDTRRPLSDGGRDEVEAMARFLAGAGVRPARIIHADWRSSCTSICRSCRWTRGRFRYRTFIGPSGNFYQYDKQGQSATDPSKWTHPLREPLAHRSASAALNPQADAAFPNQADAAFHTQADAAFQTRADGASM